MTGMETNAPNRMTMPKSAFRMPATARGPGVGGTNMWVACRPIASEMAMVVMEILVSLDRRRAMGLSRTNAESQKTGIETK